MSSLHSQRVVLTSAQHTTEGKTICTLYHYGVLSALLKKGEFDGAPYHGMSHALELNLAPEDITAFFEILISLRFPGAYLDGIAVLQKKAYEQIIRA